MEYKYPNKAKLINTYLKNYGEEFLSLNNLNIGDKVMLEFTCHELKSKYKSREMERFTKSVLSEGILKIGITGGLIAESIIEMSFYYQQSNGRSGRDYRTWYDLRMQKPVIEFGKYINF